MREKPSNYVEATAVVEDDYLAWWRKHDVTRRQARASAAHDWDVARRRVRVESCWLREVESADEFEGPWYEVCDAGHLEAFEAWQASERLGLHWWLLLRTRPGRQLRTLAARRRNRSHAVPWGGRMERHARWFDRLLEPGIFRVLGDRQLQLHEGALHWCDVCRVETLHWIRYNGAVGGCTADKHFERAIAPLKDPDPKVVAS